MGVGRPQPRYPFRLLVGSRVGGLCPHDSHCSRFQAGVVRAYGGTYAALSDEAEALQAQHGIPGLITFDAGNGGLTRVTLRHPNGSEAEV